MLWRTFIKSRSHGESKILYKPAVMNTCMSTNHSTSKCCYFWGPLILRPIVCYIILMKVCVEKKTQPHAVNDSDEFDLFSLLISIAHCLYIHWNALLHLLYVSRTLLIRYKVCTIRYVSRKVRHASCTIRYAFHTVG